MKMKVADTQKDFFGCVRVRLEVFVIGQNVDVLIEQEENDDQAIHFIAYDDQEKPIAACRVLLEEDCAHLGRLAVLKEYRGRHIGADLLLEAEKHPEVIKKGRICLHAQLHAKEFYQKCGYTASGEVFYEAGIAHVMMEKKL